MARRRAALLATILATCTLAAASGASVAPSGQILAVVDAGAFARLCLVTPRGLRALPLKGRFDDADWSPSGARFVYSAGQVDGTWLAVTAAAGGSKRRIVGASNALWDLDWSPDGRRIAFVVAEWNGPETAVVVVRQDRPAAAPRYVVGGSFDREDFGEYGSPSWSPDSRRLAYAMRVGERTQVFVAGADGSGIRQLTTAGGSDPSWAPNGAGIAFHAERGGVDGLYLVRPDGSGERLLAQGVTRAEWSPDGRWLAYVRSGGRELVKQPSTGGAPVVVARSAHPIVDLAWRPRGPASAAPLPARPCR
jgi:Tol biopolymer transport system component